MAEEIKKILIPTDFSECAEYAAEVAASIAKKTGAEVYLLHVIDIPVYSDNSRFEEHQEIPEAMFIMKHARNNFKELKSKPFFQGVKVYEAVEFDNTYNKIAEDAKKHNIDLIVMGTHGTSGIKEMFVGSITEKVARESECPVLAIKNRNANFELKEVVFASNFYGEVENVFPELRKLLDVYKPTIHLLLVNTPVDFKTHRYNEKLIKEFAEKFNIENYTVNVYDDYSQEEGIRHFSQDMNADAIIMATHGRTGLSHLINGSIAEDVVNHAEMPVITLKITEPKEKKGVIFPEHKR